MRLLLVGPLLSIRNFAVSSLFAFTKTINLMSQLFFISYASSASNKKINVFVNKGLTFF